jgi:hypothetical protein
MRGAVASPDEIVVAELVVYAAAVVVVLPAFSAATDFEGTQSCLCSDHNLAAVTAEIGAASALE